jgi:hypothetical protein
VGGAGGGPAYPEGETYGQGGWDVGVNFVGLHDLATKLFHNPVCPPDRSTPIRRGEVTRLAINAHGTLGAQVFINGTGKEPLTPDTIKVYYQDLNDIGLATSETNTVILFMGCLAGQGKDGSRLLLALADIWPGRKVVGFLTNGYAPGGPMTRRRSVGCSEELCTEPGMRETDSRGSTMDPTQEKDYLSRWNQLDKLPWASEFSRSAKVALKQPGAAGQIIKNADL